MNCLPLVTSPGKAKQRATFVLSSIGGRRVRERERGRMKRTEARLPSFLPPSLTVPAAVEKEEEEEPLPRVFSAGCGEYE